MNIIEVLKTGKNVYAPFSFSWGRHISQNQTFDRGYFLSSIFPNLREEHLLRDDWDVEPEKKIEITKSQLAHAIKCADAAETFFPYSPTNKEFLNRVAKELGLE